MLNTPLLDPPRMEPWTLAELQATPRTVKGKVLRCLANMSGYVEVAEAAVQAHQDYERKIFGGVK
ncbi:MAG: hypothetical protein M1438_09600 [Deltaproteobacteria bacterium]|nr:hypothetical protein [Deltaproteobacteria bacterium]